MSTESKDAPNRTKPEKPKKTSIVRKDPSGFWSKLRRRTYNVLEVGSTASRLAIAFDIFLVLLILANVAAAMIESVPEYGTAYHAQFTLFEIVSVAIFSVEYLMRLWSSVEDPRYYGLGPFWGRVRFAFQPVALIDFLAVGPSLVGLFFGTADLRALRVFRLLRILKIVRYSPALTTLTDILVAERRALLGTLLLLMCVMVMAAEAMYLIEGADNPKMFGNLPQSMYWAITTLTTVGYGDNYPITPLGKIVAGITMIIGLGLFALPVGIVATNFVTEIHRRDFVVTWSMLARVPLFKDLDVDIIVTLMGYLRSQVVHEHAILARRGAVAEQMFFIVSGRARIEDPGNDGPPQSLGPGDYYGAGPLLNSEAYDVTVTARTEMRILTLSHNDLAVLVRKYPRLKRQILQPLPPRPAKSKPPPEQA
ncbi:MAG TPA: cyclic nucleotide-gated ion channel [Rhizomicrobium sp.]|jgi:voltage-gated potassium channel